MNDYELDIELAYKISEGDNLSWNFFVDKYSDYILSNIVIWCKSSCQVFNNQLECVVQAIKNKKKIDNANACDEGMELYLYIFSALKLKVVKYQGKSSLKTFLTACLKFIYNDYFITKYGKINIPTALKDIDDKSKKIYKILCRSKDINSAYEKCQSLNIDKEDFDNSYNLIISLLKKDGDDKAWQHLFSQFSKNTANSTLDFINADGEEAERSISIDPKEIVNKELIDIFTKCFNALDKMSKRLLKLKFKENKSIKEIFIKYADLFNFNKEQDVYSQIDKSIKILLSEMKLEYEAKEDSDIKEFKDTLYDIFQIVSV